MKNATTKAIGSAALNLITQQVQFEPLEFHPETEVVLLDASRGSIRIDQYDLNTFSLEYPPLMGPHLNWILSAIDRVRERDPGQIVAVLCGDNTILLALFPRKLGSFRLEELLFTSLNGARQAMEDIAKADEIMRLVIQKDLAERRGVRTRIM
jgi:hypothetical protein